VLESLASGEKTISELAKDADIRLTHLPRLLTKLIEYDLVYKEGGRYFIVDKVVRDYFKMRSQP
jgi:DNA-binding IclR family transcriptional regulator